MYGNWKKDILEVSFRTKTIQNELPNKDLFDRSKSKIYLYIGGRQIICQFCNQSQPEIAPVMVLKPVEICCLVLYRWEKMLLAI